ncbi:uncharacterized protein LOC125596618 [Brassica napus]|uniref:uncharacterized protein LOC125596618 n=1 Tax=Brassica napus TaxID=3708 RepID=UPI002078C957|nr:uncharacterized protein LOC125596618 [Brassica napus]
MGQNHPNSGSIERFSDFEVEFNHKYFPAEAWDRLEAKFLYLVQGRRTVREYEEEFNRLWRYVGKELEDESVQEAKLKTRSHTAPSGGSNDRKRKRDQAEEGKPSSGRPECPKCGRHHGGECWRAMGACLRCGKMDHSARDCPRQEQGASGDTWTCHYCGKKGHLLKDCPKLLSGPSKSRGEVSRPDQKRGQTSAPHIYELSKDEDRTGPFQAITGMLGKGLFQLGTGDCPEVVNAAGGQVMRSLGVIRDIPVVIQDRVMPVDLVVVHLKNHEVILRMD